MNDKKTFVVTNKNENEIAIYQSFYNPLQYKSENSCSQVDDPLYDALSQFQEYIDGLVVSNPVFKSLGEPASELEAALYEYNKSDEKTETKDPDSCNLNQLSSILLNDWLYQLKSNSNVESMKNEIIIKLDNPKLNKSEREKLQKSLDDIIEVTSKGCDAVVNMVSLANKADKFLYGEIKVTNMGASAQLANIIKSEKTALAKEMDFVKFKELLVDARSVLEDLEKIATEAKSGLQIVNAVLAGDNKDIKGLVGDEVKFSAFRLYSQSYAPGMLANANKLMDENNELISKFRSFLDDLDKFVEPFDEAGYSAICSDFLSHDSRKMLKCNMTFAELNKENNKASKIEFYVAKKQAVIPAFGVGGLFAGFTYQNFAIANDSGVGRVSQTKDTKVIFRPAGFINLLIYAGNDFWYPFVQLGVTTGIKDVMFPVGGGFTLSKSVSLSGGALIGYHKVLDKLSVGDEADDAKLQDDLKIAAKVSWYVSVTYNVGKKKD